MSVLVASTNAYERVFVKAVDYTFRKTCDINYCSALSHFTEYDLKKLVERWADLNNDSYTARYDKKMDELKYSTFLKLKYQGDSINTYQMLKTLQCIQYNIEVGTIEEVRPLTVQEKDAMNILNRAIDEIQGAIINTIPEYQAAIYCI